MDSSFRIDVNKTGAFLCSVKLKCKEVSAELGALSLLDTGAGICHMTYALWCDIGLNKVYLNERQDLLKYVKSTNADEFENLLLAPVSDKTVLGNGLEVTAYEFRLDELVMSSPTHHGSIRLNNITVRLIYSEKSAFIIGTINR